MTGPNIRKRQAWEPVPGAYAGSERGPVQGRNPPGRWLHGDVSTTSTETTAPALTAADRCDACGAQAYVRVLLDSGQLIFCAHHARKHAETIDQVANHVQDETSRLYEADDTES